jgi:transposase
VLEAKARRDRLDQTIVEVAAAQPYREIVARLSCLRGVSTLTALALTVELGDWQRFDPARLGAFLGLVPSEQSSGEQRRQGPITKTGNGHARRLLVEAAWHRRRPLRPSLALAGRPPASPQRRAPRPKRSRAGCTAADGISSGAASAARSSWSPSVRARPAIAFSWSTRCSAVNSEADGRGCRVVACSRSG